VTTTAHPTTLSHARPAPGLAGGRKGLDRALLFVVVGMVSLSFKTGPWQSLHALGWILMIAVMVRDRRWEVPGPSRWAIPWGLFAAWVFLSSVLSPDPSRSLYDTKKLLNLLALFLIGAVLVGARDYLHALVAIASVSAVHALIGLYQFVTTADPIAFRPHGVSNHMTYSGMLLITLCMVLPLLTFRKTTVDLLWWGYAVLALVALLTSLTRSAWIGFAVALAVVLLFKNPRWLLVLPVLLVILLVSVPEVRERTRSLFDLEGDYASVHRISMYHAGLRMVADHPLLGVGGRPQVVARYREYEGTPATPPPEAGPDATPYPTPAHLHSNALQLAAAFGLPALVAWLAALLVWLRELLRQLPRRRDVTGEAGRLRRNLLLASLAGGAGFLTMGMVEYNFGDSEVSVLFFFALSIPFVLGRDRDHGAVQPSRSG
jgi:O-antigen ligase